VLGRRARREAGAAAAAAAVRDPRRELLERILTWFQLAGNVLALLLSVVAWAWVAMHRSGATPARASGALTDDVTAVPGLGGLLHPLTSLPGAALVLVTLPACLLMAPSVNPFYAPLPERRALAGGRTAVFAVLAVSTIALIAVAAR
jgi:hypothetical protein